MTLPDERTRAVLNARNFLRDLIDPRKTPKVPKYIRIEAGNLLKHYPSDFDFNTFFNNNREIFGKLNED